MDELAQQLCSLDAAGCYTLQCDPDQLRSAIKQTGYALFDVDLKGVKGKQRLLAMLAQAVNFPAGFGVNWDALVDALCDLSWVEAEGYVLLLRHASDTLGLSANDREIVQDIFADTVLYWQQHKKIFWVFFA